MLTIAGLEFTFSAFLMAAAVASDVIGRRLVRIFPIEFGMRNLGHYLSFEYTYSFSVAFGNREEQHIQPIRKKEKVKNRF